MSNAGGTAIGYNSMGGINSIGTTSFTYSKANRMASATVSGTATNYTYDADGYRLTSKTGSNPTNVYNYDQAGMLLAELNGTTESDYAWLDGMPVALIQPASSAVTAIHTDKLGTPQKGTNASKTLTWALAMTPNGGGTPSPNTTPITLRYPGMHTDATPYYNNGYRDYIPDTTPGGRYLQVDPIGLAGGINPYVYAGNNAFKYVDSLGLTAACPSTLGAMNPQACSINSPEGFVPYGGGQSFANYYHLGGTSFMEYRSDTSSAVNDPVAECVYDPTGGLIDNSHPFRMAQGTPDQYPVYGPLTWGNLYNHKFYDIGGPSSMLSNGQTLGDAAHQASVDYFNAFKANPSAVTAEMLLHQFGLSPQPQMSMVPLASHTSTSASCGCRK